MNDCIHKINKESESKKCHMRKICYITKREFWIFWGLIGANHVTGMKNGNKMFKPLPNETGLLATIDCFDPGTWMKGY